MLDSNLPPTNNIVLAAMLFSLLGLAHLIAHKRNILGHQDMRNRLHVAWGIALIALPAVLYPKSIGLVLWASIPVLAWQEWNNHLRFPESTKDKVWWMGIAVYLVQLTAIFYLPGPPGWATAVLPCVFVLAACTKRRLQRWVFAGIAATLLLPALALPLLMHARLSVLVWCFVIPQLFDAFQYIVGRKFGKTPLSRWSPKKTWEGLLGGAFLAWLAAMLLSPWLPWSTMQTAQMTVLLLSASYLGGLASSMLKRLLGLKDWGKSLGSHGGVLDRMDSLVFSLPIAWGFYTWHLHFGI